MHPRICLDAVRLIRLCICEYVQIGTYASPA